MLQQFIQPGKLRRYSNSSFTPNATPISENGTWHNNGVSWTSVTASGGIAFGTQDGSGGFDDSYAILYDFPPNYTCTGVIHKAGSGFGTFQEVEIRMRNTDNPNTSKCYECLIAFDGAYAQIVRWNGALNDFTHLVDFGSFTAPANGDSYTVSISGNIITMMINSTTLGTLDITSVSGAVYNTGNPGIGFFRQGGTASAFGFSSFSATGLP